MISKKDNQVKTEYLEDKDIHNVQKKILIGPEDGSNNIIMRRFTLTSGGFTPHHTHDFEHVVRIEKGKGIVVNESGEEVIVSKGDSLFINNNEKHQFRNPYKKPLEFLCIIINQDSS
jgi:quercetin dioxygenase-like cupin family protein